MYVLSLFKLNAMGTSGTDAVAYSGEEEEEEEEYYEVEHLPPLLEDEENVSLADILSLRDSCMSELEVWAVCVECVLALQSIAPSPLFHTLCITPDTLAFNAHGKVCFMEQLSDDPEGSFIPPEFDKTGSTYEGHVYSLGSTLSAALDFVIEPELEAELGEETRKLLEQMQEDRPEDRPHPDDILSLAETNLAQSSSTAVCRKLSSTGRRVLSIESVSTCQDRWEDSWEARWQQPRTKHLFQRSDSDDSGKDDSALPGAVAENPGEKGLSRHQVCGGWDSSMWAEGMEGDSDGDLVAPTEEDGFGSLSDSRSQNSSPVCRRAQERAGGRVRGVLNRSCSVPDSNNPRAVPPTPHGDISIPVSDLTEIGAEGRVAHMSVWSNGLQRGERQLGSPDRSSHSERYVNCFRDDGTSGEYGDARLSGSSSALDSDSFSQRRTQDPTLSRSTEDSLDSARVKSSVNNNLYSPNNHMTKSMLCLNEETQDEWISLRELLTQSGRSMSVNELWALCHTCLSTLQTYIDFPEYLCLDTMYVGCGGEALFLKPKNTGSYDVFYLAPEFQEHGIVTEKACVYGVAAILWTSAKFGLSANQKLAMPRKLKRLLLEMAKRTPLERPSIAMAKKSCRDYLSHQGTNAEAVWTTLINIVHQPLPKDIVTEDLNVLDYKRGSNEESTHVMSGFVPMATESRLAPVPGPVPHSYPISRNHQLPEAFTSPATHFTPIVLTQERTPRPASDIEGAVDEFTRGLHIQDPPPLPPAGRGLQRDGKDGPVTQRRAVTPNSSSTASGGRTVVDSPPPSSPERTDQGQTRGPLPPTSSSSSRLAGCGVFNNFLLRQDRQTGHLTLLPVQITASDFGPGLDLNLPLISSSLRSQRQGPRGPEGVRSNCVTVTMSPRDHLTFDPAAEPSLPCPVGSPSTSSRAPDSTIMAASQTHHREAGPGTGAEGESQHGVPLGAPPPPPSSPLIHPALREVIALLRGEFAFHGYLENGVEDLAMGEYIFSLKDLQYHTFASVVREKICDLYWEEDLLGVLHCLVNHSQFSLGSNEQSPSKPLQRAASPASPLSAGRGEERSGGTHQRDRQLDLNGNLRHGGPVGPEVWKRAEGEQTACAQHRHTETVPEEHTQTGAWATGPVTVKGTHTVTSEELQRHVCHGVRTAEGLCRGGAMESGGHPVEAGDESPSEADSLWGAGEPPRGGQMSPDSSEDMEDTDSLASEGLLLSPRSGAEDPSPSPAWALAFHGEACFSQDMVEYTLSLGRRRDGEPPCLGLQTQELQQQLMIETRNLKKTRNFYQKLLHQERKCKASEAKLMLSKLKVQLDELKSKVEFLVSVKKYLEVLRMDQWGMDVALLHALAASGQASLDLLLEDLAVLSFGTVRGKSCLQAGSPLGLMSYLYARNAFLEGYIQQFLYTYRYFCSPEDLLQFLIVTFSSAAGGGPDRSGDSAKVYHRSLDLLQAWLTDCRLMDFNPKSSCLLGTLENFLTTQVVPVDSRGERLLATLKSSPLKRRSQGCGSPMSIQEEEDSSCGESSTDASGRKNLQWRISRVVDSQTGKEKSYSIAAALPLPCYASLMDDLSTACLRNQERQPFCQTEHSAQLTAQQLTLLQQEIFQDCHPVHFLNSRAQGVQDKAVSITKNVSHHVPPVEGSGLFVSEGMSQDSPLQQLLTYADSVTNWVSAEIVICDSVKTQVALLTKFLLIAKCCYESRNFATAMQVLGGLENVIVRQLPAWKHLSTKVFEVLEELRAVQVFLKSDNLCLMGGEQGRRATLPAPHILAMHIQQLEIGAFTLISGAYKWPKLRNIAKVVSQLHAFQETVYPYAPALELQAYLRLRVAHLSGCDVTLLASDNDANFHQPPTRRIQDKLKRVKATFQ